MRYTKKKTGFLHYDIYSDGRLIGMVSRGGYGWNLFAKPGDRLMANGYPNFKEAMAAFKVINEGGKAEPPSRKPRMI
jgi:hypothetical protein